MTCVPSKERALGQIASYTFLSRRCTRWATEGGNSKSAIHAFAGLFTIEDDNAGLVEKQTADKIIAHPPQLGEFFHRVMAFKRGLVFDRR